MKLKAAVAKAKRTLIAISEEINLEGYMMPDSSYTLNATSLTRAIRKHRAALLQFLGGKSPQAQSCQGFSLLQIEEVAIVENNARIKPIPLYVAAAFLRYWDKRGNAQASAIVEALTTGHLITLFDDAFGVRRTASERQEFMLASLSIGGVETTQQVDARVKQLEEMLAVQEQKLAIQRGSLEESRKVAEFHEGESLKGFREKMELYSELQETKSRLENLEGDYRRLIGSYQKIDQENRRLERQIAEISQEALVAWKKIGTMQEQITTRFWEPLLIGNGNGR
jgi:hypothetical protein